MARWTCLWKNKMFTMGGELVYGRSPQRVTWGASGDFVWCNLIESKLTVNSFTESRHSGIISGHVPGTTWGHPPCCSTVLSSIRTSHSCTSARALLRWHLLREAFFDPTTLVAATFRCYYISLTLLFLQSTLSLMIIYIWEVIYFFMSPPTLSFMKPRHIA